MRDEKELSPEEQAEAREVLERLRAAWNRAASASEDQSTEPAPPPEPVGLDYPGEPWPVHATGEVVHLGGYRYRVCHVGPAHLLLEPAAPFLVGSSEAAPATPASLWRRLTELWNAVSYASTTLSRLLGATEQATAAREVLRVVRLAQEGGPRGNQVGPETGECMSLDQLASVAEARLLARWKERTG